MKDSYQGKRHSKTLTSIFSLVWAIAGLALIMPMTALADASSDQVSELKQQIKTQQKKVDQLSRKLDRQIARGSGPRSTMLEHTQAMVDMDTLTEELFQLTNKGDRAISSNNFID